LAERQTNGKLLFTRYCLASSGAKTVYRALMLSEKLLAVNGFACLGFDYQ